MQHKHLDSCCLSLQKVRTKKENKNWTIPALAITDFPRYDWRGYMKDVSRTFYSVDVVKKYLDHDGAL